MSCDCFGDLLLLVIYYYIFFIEISQVPYSSLQLEGDAISIYQVF